MRYAIIAAALVALPLAAAAEPAATDANIVTGFDVSGSMKPDDMRTQIVGFAQALQAPDVIEAIGRGHHGRIGIAVYTWSKGTPGTVVSWTVVATREDALFVAAQVAAYFATGPVSHGVTDIGGAIRAGMWMLANAPTDADRNVINLIGNGTDNSGRKPAPIRDAFVRSGGTINGVVLTSHDYVRNHYRDDVVGGIGSFVLSARDSRDIVNLMRRKLILDLVSIGGHLL